MAGLNVFAVSGWSPPAWFLTTAPEKQDAVIDRPRVIGAIDEAVRTHRLTVVTAPAGFGKTVALSEWSRSSGLPTAWLTLTPLDDDPGRILGGIVAALQRLALTSDAAEYLPVLDIAPGFGYDDVRGYESLVHALAHLTQETVLVIDDAHRAGRELAGPMLRSLLERPPPALRIIVCGQQEIEPQLSRLTLLGGIATVRGDLLAFTAPEIVAASAALGDPVAPAAAGMIHEATAGWPAAVRLSLVSPRRDGSSQTHAFSGSGSSAADTLAGFVAEEILGPMPADDAQFVLHTTTCNRLDGRLADALTGRDDGAAMLARLFDRGLFLDRFALASGEESYRWHTVFARQCRIILRRTDPALARELSRTAAAELADGDPLTAVSHALRAQEPALAVRVVEASWMSLFIGARASALNRVCAQLPAPWAQHPSILLIRACCLDVLGDRAGGALLTARAEAILRDTPQQASDQTAVIRAAAALFVNDRHDVIVAARQQLEASVRSGAHLSPHNYCCALFLLGWTELRNRGDVDRAAQRLQAAVREASALGATIIADRAAASLAMTYALAGRFGAAGRALAAARRPVEPAHPWRRYDGGVEAVAAGWLAYWRDDLTEARCRFREASALDPGRISYPALARTYLANIAAVSGDPDEIAEALVLLEGVSDRSGRGVPFGAYKLMARARLTEAQGGRREAVAMARGLIDVPSIPATLVQLAALLRRAGRYEEAEHAVRRIGAHMSISYVRVSALLTRAVIVHETGARDQTAELLDASLAAAVGEGIRRPFGREEEIVHDLLAEHVQRGTPHQAFATSLIDAARSGTAEAITAREREVLERLRTPMTIAEIGTALGISANTVKTHQKALYRKLNVSGRRELQSGRRPPV